MLSHADNQLLTSVQGPAPLGAMLRRNWIPVLRSEALEADGAPIRVKACGQTAVAFRATDGRVGVLEEACAHRCASLMLGRNEGNGLRCIFHGWKVDVDGNLVDIPTEPDPERAERIRSRVKSVRYPVHEAGGLVWVYFGEGAPPPFQQFEFTVLDASHRDIRMAIVPCNWLQTMEAILDSAHLGFLHSSSVAQSRDAPSQKNADYWLQNPVPRLQVKPVPYGLREAALRDTPEGRVNARIREVVFPWHVILPGEPQCERQHIITVPIDDTSCLQVIVTYNPYRPMTREEIDTLWFDTHPDANNIAQGIPGRETNWDQDREAMKQGHYSGLTKRHVFCEDFAVLESMGPIVDRTKEHLMQVDLTISTVRRELLRALKSGAPPAWEQAGAGIDFSRLRSWALVVDSDDDWKQISAFVDDGTGSGQQS